MWDKRKQSVSKYRALACLVLLLFVSHTVLDGLHHAMVQHITCPEHGEQLHHHAHGSHAHENHTHEHHAHQHEGQQDDTSEETTLPLVQKKDKEQHDHHVCGLYLEVRKRLAFLTPSFWSWFLSPSEPTTSFATTQVFIPSQQPRLSLAPKQSPPV